MAPGMNKQKNDPPGAVEGENADGEPCNSQVRPGEYSQLVLKATPKLIERSPVDIPEEADVIDDLKPSTAKTAGYREPQGKRSAGSGASSALASSSK